MTRIFEGSRIELIKFNQREQRICIKCNEKVRQSRIVIVNVKKN